MRGAGWDVHGSLVQSRRCWRCMAVWRASSGSHHGGADWRSIWWRPRTVMEQGSAARKVGMVPWRMRGAVVSEKVEENAW